MVERMGYVGGYNNDYEDEDEQYQEGQAKYVPWYRRADPDYDPEEEEHGEASLEEFHEHPEHADHQLEHAADDIAQLEHAADDGCKVDFLAQYEWRVKARSRRTGRFVPPLMTGYRWPVFVRFQDLKDHPQRV